MTLGLPETVALREPVDRPRLLRLAIRSESAPVDGPEVSRGVVARIEGGYFVAGPPATPFHTVALWANSPQTAVAVGCMPVDAETTVEVRAVRESAEAEPGPAAADRVEVHRYGGVVTLTCLDGADSAPALVVDLLWEDG